MRAPRARRRGSLAALRGAVLPRAGRKGSRTLSALPRRAFSFVGRDMAHPARSRTLRSRRWLPAGLVGVFIATLALTALRRELIGVRYEIIAAVDEEARLREERDRWIARVQALRDPARLSGLARQRGFDRPDRAIDLRSPLDGGTLAELFAEFRPVGGSSH